jgi:hypothetical protein
VSIYRLAYSFVRLDKQNKITTILLLKPAAHTRTMLLAKKYLVRRLPVEYALSSLVRVVCVVEYVIEYLGTLSNIFVCHRCDLQRRVVNVPSR